MGSRQSKPEAPKSPPPTSKPPVESCLGINRASETGLDRVKSLFIFKPFPLEVREILIVTVAGSFVGMIFGGLIGSRQMGDKFIMLNQHSKFSSIMQAQRELHSAAMLGFISRGLKWARKIGGFAGVIVTTAVLLATYRDKDDPWNYLAAGGLIGGLYRINWGFMPFVGGTTLGLLVTLPPFTLLYIVDKLLVSKEEKFKAREELFIARCVRRNYWECRNKREKSRDKRELSILESITEGDEVVGHFMRVPRPERPWWKWKWSIWKQDKEFQKAKEKKWNSPKNS